MAATVTTTTNNKRKYSDLISVPAETETSAAAILDKPAPTAPADSGLDFKVNDEAWDALYAMALASNKFEKGSKERNSHLEAIFANLIRYVKKDTADGVKSDSSKKAKTESSEPVAVEIEVAWEGFLDTAIVEPEEEVGKDKKNEPPNSPDEVASNADTCSAAGTPRAK